MKQSEFDELMLIQEVNDLLPDDLNAKLRIVSFMLACLVVQAGEGDEHGHFLLREHLKLAHGVAAGTPRTEAEWQAFLKAYPNARRKPSRDH